MRRLYDLEPAEVSLVPQGANKKKFLIFKNDDGVTMSREELLKQINKVSPATMKQVEKVLKDYDAMCKDGEGTGLSDRAQAALKAVARILAPFKDEITDDVIDQVLESIGISADEPGETGEGGDVGKLGAPLYPPTQPRNTNKGKDGKDGKDGDDKNKDDKGEPVSKEQKQPVIKADGTIDFEQVPQDVRPALELIWKSNQELIKKNGDLEKTLNDRAAAETEREIVAKAATFSHLATSKEDVVAMLKDAHKSGKESYERVCKSFATQNEQARASRMFNEVGSSLPGASGAADTQAKIDAAVDAIVQKSNGSTTKEQAYANFIQTPEGQRMYGEFKQQRPGGI